MTTPNPTPARDAVASLSDESAMELAQDLAEDCIVVRGEPDVDGRTVGEIVGARVRARLDALITAARADEQAQWAARATEQERGMVERLIEAAHEDAHDIQYFGQHYDNASKEATTLLAALTAARERGERMEEALGEIERKAAHFIPFYAYGDNEAACDMSDRLSEIAALAGRKEEA
ncbi:MAG: hypothetical protein IPL76_10565 [Gemmatimonadetes bacterium]|nr:hypothetical protein [Gemmatimonadota bacterium]